MFLLDDLFLKPFVSLLTIIHDMALEEQYDVEAIRDELKENRLLYEVGELDQTEYERRKDELEAELEVAQKARERLSGRVEVKG
ncbi:MULTISPECIES: gas vesicle protein GvpG [Haloarcula]|mgnify:CR=1 FL=1|uniref:Gas vesicle protein GvpG n=2 Tax=Haloarcula TaxID=2237 RepID=A0A8J7Y7C5_9EURY|nr:MULTISPECIES: protein gvpG [Halomicroarcula]MBV0926055.1 gas vesicle protein GvpG [Halomicroarcula limicola]MBX0296214.1 gas vesicle protein GvpG [Halomicroarcula nitratireducens]